MNSLQTRDPNSGMWVSRIRSDIMVKPHCRIARTVNLGFPYTKRVFLTLRRDESKKIKRQKISGTRCMKVLKYLQKVPF